jgi:hypothetical protein
MNARTLSPASNRLGVKHVIATPDPAAGFFTAGVLVPHQADRSRKKVALRINSLSSTH